MSVASSESSPFAEKLALLGRRRWLVILPFCLAMMVGIALAVRLPRIYEANTLILVQPQRVPEKLVQPVVTADIETRINTISQQILSRSNLENVIQRFKLFEEESQTSMFMEDKVAALRKRIKVEVSRGRKDADAFSITYRDTDPRRAMQVANGLASFFINENLKVREIQAVGTSDFLEAELESMRGKLEEQEQKLKTFRQQHMGELPEQLDSNLKILERLNATLAQKEESLRSARVSLAALESEVAARQAALASSASPSDSAAGKPAEDRLSLPQLKERLLALQSSYTDEHPDIVRLKARIQKMEEELGSTAQTDAGQGSLKAALAIGSESVRRRSELMGAIRGLEGEIARLNQEIKEYQRRVEATPRREQELLSLRRDYDNIKASYNSLLNRKLEADIAVNMERKQKGEQFQVIDPARLPERPVSPNLNQLFLLTVLAGLAAGIGLVMLLDQFDTSLRRQEEIEEDFGLAVLATIPQIPSRRDLIRRRIMNAATVISLVLALSLTAGLAMFSFYGVEQTIDLLRQYATG